MRLDKESAGSTGQCVCCARPAAVRFATWVCMVPLTWKLRSWHLTALVNGAALLRLLVTGSGRGRLGIATGIRMSQQLLTPHTLKSQTKD